MELYHFDKHFVKSTRNKGPIGNYFVVFLLGTIQNYILNGKSTQTSIQSGLFSQKTEYDFQKRVGDASPTSPPIACMQVWLNVHQYPWISLNILFWLWQGSKCAWSYYMFDRLFRMPQFLNASGSCLLDLYIQLLLN